jgi:hypothetical protein
VGGRFGEVGWMDGWMERMCEMRRLCCDDERKEAVRRTICFRGQCVEEEELKTLHLRPRQRSA